MVGGGWWVFTRTGSPPESDPAVPTATAIAMIVMSATTPPPIIQYLLLFGSSLPLALAVCKRTMRPIAHARARVCVLRACGARVRRGVATWQRGSQHGGWCQHGSKNHTPGRGPQPKFLGLRGLCFAAAGGERRQVFDHAARWCWEGMREKEAREGECG